MADEKRVTTERQGDVLGLHDAPVPQTDADRELAAESKRDPERARRRRRADDLVEEGGDRPADSGSDDPRGLHVER